METKIVQLENVVKTYQLGKTKTIALNNITIEIKKGEFCVFIGPSGSGKTTLLNLIGLLDHPTSGIVQVFGCDINNLKEQDLCRIRRERIGFVFQNFSLLEVLTVEENVGYPLMLRKVPKKLMREKVDSILNFVGLIKYKNRRPNILSGGERQRVAIARAFVNEPELIIADEFTANLDTKTSLDILQLMKKYHGQHQTTFIIATHDPLLKDYAERIVHLKDRMIQNQ